CARKLPGLQLTGFDSW
nr:immunoglobulin heavy chain junction region [Macaca mulatta]MOX59181.1 immunoglobulin heavy chain junction region [Macaca mulatta]MOX59645.1 immunoglobulin heavy chain junction region [Macaca mulatta]MOX59930.1 immunoglobulin heavy chain junction region [Macaca mulatta]MOX60528.1 immunoglobulin heavy chain junction region [Macaca mulatta]